MFKWFGKQETRSTYTDHVVSALLAAATGSATDVGTTAAVQVVAGAVGRAFALASTSEKLLTPGVLTTMGTDLVRYGSTTWLIDPEGLFPVAGASLKAGNYNPKSWRYDVDLNGPHSTTTKKNVPYEDLISVRLNTDSMAPWQGVSYTTKAKTSSALTANLLKSLSDEASGPVGSFFTVPGGDLKALTADIKTAKGAALAVQGGETGFETDNRMSPQSDFVQKRFGVSTPQGTVELLKTAYEQTLNSLGVSGSLFSSTNNAGAIAAYRQFAFGLVLPLGRLVEAECSEKLETKITLDFASIRAVDVAARATGFNKLVQGGMDLEKALAISGLLQDEK